MSTEGGAQEAPYRWVVLAVATLTQAATAFVFLGVGTLAGFVQEDLGLSGVRTGLLVTAVGLVPLFALLPVGGLLDRHGERLIVAAGALLLAAGIAAAALAPTYPLLLAVLLVGGTGYATAQPGGSKAVAGWFDARQRGLAMGIRQTGLPLGGALAAAVLPALAGTFGWRTALPAAAAVAAAGGLTFGAWYRSSGTHAVSRYAFAPRLRGLLAAPRIRPILWAGVAMVSTQFATISYLMLDLRDRHGMPLVRGAWVLFTAQMLGVVGRIVLASWSDRFGSGRRLRPVLVSTLAAAAGAAAIPLLPPATPPLAIFVLAAAFGFFTFGWYGPWVVHVAESGQDDTVGLTLGLAMTANQLGIVAAPPIFGALLDLTGGYTAPWLAVSALLVATAGRLGLATRCGHA